MPQDATVSAVILYLIGVTACGKTAVGHALAKTLPNAVFLDGDDYHSPEAKKQMAHGVPLSDGDRGPWLARISEAAIAKVREHATTFREGDAPFCVIVACSALKRAYRDTLRGAAKGVAEGLTVRFVHLASSQEVLEKRLRERSEVTEHFMKNVSILKSQFATLEPPTPDGAMTIDVTSLSPDQISQDISVYLHKTLLQNGSDTSQS